MSAGSFIEAASRLGVSKSIVSRRILRRQQPRARLREEPTDRHSAVEIERKVRACREIAKRRDGRIAAADDLVDEVVKNHEIEA